APTHLPGAVPPGARGLAAARRPGGSPRRARRATRRARPAPAPRADRGPGAARAGGAPSPPAVAGVAAARRADGLAPHGPRRGYLPGDLRARGCGRSLLARPDRARARLVARCVDGGGLGGLPAAPLQNRGVGLRTSVSKLLLC